MGKKSNKGTIKAVELIKHKGLIFLESKVDFIIKKIINIPNIRPIKPVSAKVEYKNYEDD